MQHCATVVSYTGSESDIHHCCTKCVLYHRCAAAKCGCIGFKQI